MCDRTRSRFVLGVAFSYRCRCATGLAGNQRSREAHDLRDTTTNVGFEPRNPASVHLYRSVGFEPVTRTDVFRRMDKSVAT